MGSLNGRVRRLEDILGGASLCGGTPEEREAAAERLHRESVERMKRRMESARQKAQDEAAAGDDRRLRAIEDLEERMRRRARGD